jgi:hypothetical protein
VTEPKNGNTIKNASEGNYAVQGGNDVVERANELNEGSSDKGNEKQGDKKEPDTGEKRGRGDADGDVEMVSEEGHKPAEEPEGRDAKKPKTGEVEDAGTKNGSSKPDGNGAKKDDKQENEELTVKLAPKEEQKAPKKRGPGRPKKSESKTEKTAGSAPNSGDSIGKRTRSKA